ncbi:MAG: VIT1/CCC1 transporter family protein [Candidatus Kapaibacterium sp.]
MVHLQHHREHHFTAGEMVRDIVIGMSDGLTVPFALAAGLTGAVDASGIIITAGLAEIAAGSIAMGLGGYLAARSDAEHYVSERKREEQEIITVPQIEKNEVVEIFEKYGLSKKESQLVTEALSQSPKHWVDFMMQFELGLDKPDPKRARTSAFTIAGSYIAGGFIPLSPYIFITGAHDALVISAIVTLAALLVFGYIKGRFTGAHPLRSGLQTMLIGGLAAGAAFLLAKLIS